MLKAVLQESDPDEKRAMRVYDHSSKKVVLEGVREKALSKVWSKRVEITHDANTKAIPLDQWLLSRDLIRIQSAKIGKKYILFLSADPSWTPEDRLHHILDLNGRSQGCQLYQLASDNERMYAVVLDRISANLRRAKEYEIYTLGSLPNSEGDEVAAPDGYTHEYLAELNWSFPSPEDEEHSSLLQLDHRHPMKRWRVISSADLAIPTSKASWTLRDSVSQKWNRMPDEATLIHPRYSHLDADPVPVDWKDVSECIVVFSRNHHDGFDRDFRLILDHIEHNHQLFNQNSKYLVQTRTGGECQIVFHFRFRDDQSEDEFEKLDQLLRHSDVFLPVADPQDGQTRVLYRYIGRRVVPDIFDMVESSPEASGAILHRLSAHQDDQSVRLLMPSKSGYEISYWDLPGLNDWVPLYKAAVERLQSPSFRLPAFEAVEKWERNLALEDLVQTAELEDEPWLQPFNKRAEFEFQQFEQLVKATTATFAERSSEAEKKAQEFHSEIKSIEDDLDSIRQKIPGLPDGISRLLQEMSAVLQAEASQSKSWINRVKNRESNLNASIASISDATKKLDEVARTVLRSLTTKAEGLKNQFANVNRFVADSKKASVEISNQVDAQEPKVRASIVASDDVLRSVKESRIRVNGEIQQLQKKVSDLQANHRELKNALMQKTQKRQQLQTEEQELVRTRNALEEEEREVERLALEVSNLESSIFGLRAGNPKIRQQNADLSAELSKLSSELSPLKDEQRELQDKKSELERQKMSSEERKQSIQDAISSIHEQIAGTRSELEELEADEENFVRGQKLAEGKWERLKAQLLGVQKRFDSLQSQSAAVEPPDESRYQEEFTFLKADLDRLQTSIDSQTSPKKQWLRRLLG